MDLYGMYNIYIYIYTWCKWPFLIYSERMAAAFSQPASLSSWARSEMVSPSLKVSRSLEYSWHVGWVKTVTSSHFCQNSDLLWKKKQQKRPSNLDQFGTQSLDQKLGCCGKIGAPFGLRPSSRVGEVLMQDVCRRIKNNDKPNSVFWADREPNPDQDEDQPSNWKREMACPTSRSRVTAGYEMDRSKGSCSTGLCNATLEQLSSCKLCEAKNRWPAQHPFLAASWLTYVGIPTNQKNPGESVHRGDPRLNWLFIPKCPEANIGWTSKKTSM